MSYRLKNSRKSNFATEPQWGVSWQITPLALTQAITDPDPAAAKRAFEAMMQMQKIDIATIEAARRS
jgi:predicted 3-demethylubiquinone-9 3-methyltransferase (glyoxalase superfamily)